MPSILFTMLLGFSINTLVLIGAALCQPAPSFARCHELGEKLRDVEGLADPIVIGVQGVLTMAEMNGPLAYMFLCGGANPQILCVTYGLSGRSAGQVVFVSGLMHILDPAHIFLDPCLSSDPQPETSG